MVIKVGASRNELKLEYGAGWEGYGTDGEWIEALRPLQEKLQKHTSATKGLGKGKPGK